MGRPINCDIFCAVVDNYGDIGVCWRLARQLANEYGLAVRLWVDDLASFRRLCPEINPELPVQACRGVKIRRWSGTFPETKTADLVVEAFACKLPESYVAAMAEQKHKPVWVNLEYLSAEDWVGGCHKLPSPHPQLPLVKYFFFPGFTDKTGGLLLERDLLVRRDAFLNDAQAVMAWWRSVGMEPPAPGAGCVSLFSYENAELPGLLEAWVQGRVPVRCLVPEGRIVPQVMAFSGRDGMVPGDAFRRGNLELHMLPFVEQERYDELLWACDINFVRGEDSCVRAQWAGKPFIWHIYPQHDGVHMQKLRAFMGLYCAGLPQQAGVALRALWEGWNGGERGGSPPAVNTGQAWNDFMAHQSTLRQHAKVWAQELSGNNLALNLLDFFREVGRMRAFQN